MSNSGSRKKASCDRLKQIHAKAPALPADVISPRFVADVMLGRLAKWLRISGFDILYSNRYTDDGLIAISLEEKRILLSRDTRLLIRKPVNSFIFLESDKIQDQIRQVFQATRTTSLPALLTRCLLCNEMLDLIPRAEIREVVPRYVFENQHQFKICPRCGKVYWAGTHRQSVTRILATLLSAKNSKE
jgi:uncharacterized protein with PIN domain